MRKRNNKSRTGFQPVSSGKAHPLLTGWKPVLLCAGLLLAGCKEETRGLTTTAEPVLSRQYRQGPVTVIVSASETNISTAGKILLMIDVHAAPDSDVSFPEVGYFVEPFSIADSYTEPIQMLPNGKQLHRRVWTLVPNLPGETHFEPLKITVGSTELKTDPITVQVTSLLPAGIEAFEIKDIAEPATLLPEQKKKKQFGFILLIGSAILAALIFSMKMIRRPKTVIVLAPHEIAFEALNQLPAEELAKIQALTEILLDFIEGRFQIPTTGKTINEILPHLTPWPTMDELLIAGQQIRFSNKVPAGFADQLTAYVRTFVEEMKEEPCD